MKVLVFTTLYPNNIWPNHGIFVKERMSHFARLGGCKVMVIAPVPYFPRFRIGWRWVYSQIAQKEMIDRVEVYHPRYFMIPKIGMALHGLLMFLSVLSIVKKVKKEFDFDLIDAHYVYPDGFAAVLLGRVFRKPVVVSARGSDINLFTRFPLIRRLIRYTLLKADRVISVCQALKKKMIHLGIPRNKISVIPNGVDQDKFFPFPKEEARRRLGLPVDRNVILSVGNLTSNKGFHLLIRALKVLHTKFHEKNLHLVIVGEGKFQSELERLIASLNLENHVRLAGAVSHKELYLWYSAADVFCLASSREGWPNVLLESLACGTPVVATPVGGIPEIVSSERIGLLTQRNEQEIAEGISNALKKPWQSDAIIQYARQHTWNEVALSALHVFESAP